MEKPTDTLDRIQTETGLSTNQLANLRWTDIDFVKGIFWCGPEEIILTEASLDLLIDLFQCQQEAVLVFGEEESEFIFPHLSSEEKGKEGE
jgi:hypothetical protein